MSLLTLVTPSNGQHLVALGDLASRLGLGAADYGLLDDLSLETTSMIEEYLGRQLGRQSYTEAIPGRGEDYIYLTALPVDGDSVTLTVDGTANTDFVLENRDTGRLYLSGGWPSGLEQDVIVTYTAGYLLPGMTEDWVASKAYAANDWVRPPTRSASPYLMECTTAGTTDSTEPTWPAAGSTVTDNTAVWTARDAKELPRELQRIAWLAVKGVWDARTRPFGLRRVEADGFSESYSDGSQPEGLPMFLRTALDRWRNRY